MSLTREECLKAYEDVKVDGSYTIAYKSNFDKAYSKIEEHNKGLDVFEQLIDEHFYNLPLEWEEIKKDDWVWDNVNKEYIKANPEEYDGVKFVWILFFEDGYTDTYDIDYLKFEENRFFRKQVTE